MSTAEIQIRRAGPGDAPAVAAVLLESFRDFEPLYTAGGFAATVLDPKQVLKRMDEGPVWIALHQKIAVGTVAAIRKDDSVYMRGMAVAPAARGRGVGAILVEEVERFAAAEHCRRVFLSTTPFLNSAIRLYRRFGFSRTDEGPDHLLGTPLFTMEKLISRND